MVGLVKLVLVIVVLAIAAQNFALYYSIVLAGNYMANASISAMIMTSIVWPLLVLLGAGWLIRAIFRFNPKSFDL